MDDFAKEYLHDDLRWVRQSLLFKLEGLSEYDVRRPLTKTGTNLLDLIKHLTLSEARYFGEIFGRPFPERLPRFDDPDYVNHDLPIDAPGFVPWWPRPDVKLFNVMVHVLTETNRHAGHADILREQLDGAVGAGPVTTSDHDDADWEAHRSRVEKAARKASSE